MIQEHGRVFQVNVSNGGVPKLPVREAWVTALGLKGDRQRNTTAHGGPERAVCLYSLERILSLQAEGHPVFPGSAGENLTLFGVDWDEVTPGKRLKIGEDVLLEVVSYTTPCDNLTPFFLEGNFNRIHQAKRPGWSRVYAKVLREGEVRTGDRVVIE